MKIYFYWMLTTLIFLPGCAEKTDKLESEKNSFVATNSSKEEFNLSESALSELKNKARQGDLAATIRVAQYYEYSKVSIVEAFNWYSTASNYKDVQSTLWISNYYELQGGLENCLKAKMWIAKASEMASEKEKNDIQIDQLMRGLELRCEDQNKSVK